MKPVKYISVPTKEDITNFTSKHDITVLTIEKETGSLGEYYDIFYYENSQPKTARLVENDTTYEEPISPAQAKNQFIKNIDPLMIRAVNNLLTKGASKGSIDIKTNEVVKEYRRLHKERGTVAPDPYETKQLDFEDAFRKAGWKVSFDNPGYNESYDSYYTFTAK